MDPTYTQLQMRLYKRELSEYTYRLYDKARSDMRAKGLTYLPPTPMLRGPAATTSQAHAPKGAFFEYRAAHTRLTRAIVA